MGQGTEAKTVPLSAGHVADDQAPTLTPGPWLEATAHRMASELPTDEVDLEEVSAPSVAPAIPPPPHASSSTPTSLAGLMSQLPMTPDPGEASGDEDAKYAGLRESGERPVAASDSIAAAMPTQRTA